MQLSSLYSLLGPIRRYNYRFILLTLTNYLLHIALWFIWLKRTILEKKWNLTAHESQQADNYIFEFFKNQLFDAFIFVFAINIKSFKDCWFFSTIKYLKKMTRIIGNINNE